MSVFIESLESYQVSPASRIVAWRFGPTNDDLTGVVTDVLRSYSPEDAFESVGSVSYPQTYFRDTEANLRDHWRSAYYRISVKYGGQEIEAGPTAARGTPSVIAREILRQVDIDLSFSGTPTMIYLKRKDGRCPVCWDPVLKKVTRASCPSCYATSFDGGYYAPILTLVNFQPEVKTDQPDITRHQKAQTGAKLGGFPEIRPGDVLYESNIGNRWRVSAVAQSEFDRTLLVQELTVVLLNPGDVEHKLPVPDGLDYVVKPNWSRIQRPNTLSVTAHERDEDPLEEVPIWR